MAKIIDPAVQIALEAQAAKLVAVHEKAVEKLGKEHVKALATQKKELVAVVKSVELPEHADKAVVNLIKTHHKNVLAALAV
jgi:hypothetical protein